MPMFICLTKDKWVMSRCGNCHADCGLSHPVTQEVGNRLYGAGFDKRKPALPESAQPVSDKQEPQ